MQMIYTSKGRLVVEQHIWSGIIKYVKNADGTYESFSRTYAEPKFRKTGWGKKAKAAFEFAFNKVQEETR